MAVTSDGTPYVEPGDAISAYPVVSQELAAVIDSLRTMIPVGAIFPYAGKLAPDGYLFCDGKAYTRADFYDLYQVMAEWVLQWGGFPNGNSNQFFVPDFRGRSPLGVHSTETDQTAPVELGERLGDKRVGVHTHLIAREQEYNRFFTRDSGSDSAATAMSPNVGDLSDRIMATTAPSNALGEDRFGVGGNHHPSTGVNFIVWTGTTTAGKNPVPGVELAPVTTRQMIEARLEQAGISEEEIEMLREQLAALKEDTDG